MSAETVTIYVPCYNAGRYIRDCLEGILRQTYPIDQILVIDDGSTDSTVELASRFRVRVISHGHNRGLGAARNTGVRTARNDFVAALDADCVPQSDWLERLMANFTDASISGVGGKVVETLGQTLGDRWRASHTPQNAYPAKMVGVPHLAGCNTVYRKHHIEAVGGYDERFKTNFEDLDLSERIAACGGTLVYEDEAEVCHLRQDSMRSALTTRWRWEYYAPRHARPRPLHNALDVLLRLARNARSASSIALIDLSDSPQLLIVDVLLPIYFLLLDLRALRDRATASEP